MKKALFNFLGLRNIFTDKGEFDGYYYICWLDGFDGVINIDGCTDILSASMLADGQEIVLLVSSPNDTFQQFIDPADLSGELQEKLYNYLLNYK